MNERLSAWEHLEKLVWKDVLLVIAILVATRLLALLVQWALRRAAQRVSPHHRLTLLRIVPIARLLIRLAAIVLIVPILVEPTFRNVITLAAGIALALAYTLKDYGSVVGSAAPALTLVTGFGLHAEGLRKQCCSRHSDGTGKYIPTRRLD